MCFESRRGAGARPPASGSRRLLGRGAAGGERGPGRRRRHAAGRPLRRRPAGAGEARDAAGGRRGAVAAAAPPACPTIRRKAHQCGQFAYRSLAAGVGLSGPRRGGRRAGRAAPRRARISICPNGSGSDYYAAAPTFDATGCPAPRSRRPRTAGPSSPCLRDFSRPSDFASSPLRHLRRPDRAGASAASGRRDANPPGSDSGTGLGRPGARRPGRGHDPPALVVGDQFGERRPRDRDHRTELLQDRMVVGRVVRPHRGDVLEQRRTTIGRPGSADSRDSLGRAGLRPSTGRTAAGCSSDPGGRRARRPRAASAEDRHLPADLQRELGLHDLAGRGPGGQPRASAHARSAPGPRATTACWDTAARPPAARRIL